MQLVRIEELDTHKIFEGHLANWSWPTKHRFKVGDKVRIISSKQLKALDRYRKHKYEKDWEGHPGSPPWVEENPGAIVTIVHLRWSRDEKEPFYDIEEYFGGVWEEDVEAIE